MNLPDCPRCHLYLSARGCTPERCANPEGAAELERLTREEAAGLPLITPVTLPDPSPENIAQAKARFDAFMATGPKTSTWNGPLIIGDQPSARIPTFSEVAAIVNRSDLDTFRAMLERAGSQSSFVDDDAIPTGDMVTVAFDGVLYFDRATGVLLDENEARRRMDLPWIE